MDTVYFLDTSGKRRKGIKAVCGQCGKEFLTRADQPHQFCGEACSRLRSRNRIKFVCAFCGDVAEKPVSKTKNSKSGLMFCGRECKFASQKIAFGLQEAWPKHYGTATVRNPDVYRAIYKEASGVGSLVCERCGYCEFECGVDIHHVDGDCTNNNKENLKALCSPCHRALHNGLWALAG